MHEIFTYENAKQWLKDESYLWENSFNIIEKVITASEVLISYPKNIYNEKVKENCFFLFCKNQIFRISSERGEGQAFRIISFNPANITKIILDILGKTNATLTLKFTDEDIVLSSSDSTIKSQDCKYVDILIEIAKLYTIQK